MINPRTFLYPEERSAHPILEWIFMAFLAFAASTLVIKMNLIVFGRNLIEPYIIIGGIGVCAISGLLRASFSLTLQSSGFIIFFILITVFAIWGGLTTNFNVSGLSGFLYVYSDYRSILVLIFLFFLSRCVILPIAAFDRLAVKFFILVMGFELLSVAIYNDLSLDLVYDDSMRQSTIALAPMFLVARSLISGNMIMVLFSFAATALIAVVSLMRFNYVYLLIEIMLVVGFFAIYMKNIVRFSKMTVMIATIIGITLIAIPIVLSFYESNSTRQIHGLYRLQALFGYGNELYLYNPESVRKATTKVIFVEIPNLMVPKGIGSAAHTMDVMSMFRGQYGVLSTADSGLFYLVYHFGAILGFLAIFYILKVCISTELTLLQLPNKTMFLMASAFILSFLSMLVLKSWPFMYVSVAIQYGMLIPYVIRAREFNDYFYIKFKS